MKKKTLPVLIVLYPLLSPTSLAQQAYQDFSGMWSDPPHTAEGLFCFGFCSDEGLEILDSLLDDPAYDEISYPELRDKAIEQSIKLLLGPRLTGFSRPGFPLDQAKDPGFLSCEPWGFGKQIFAPHQLEFSLEKNRIGMKYGEWDAHRTIYIDGRTAPANEPDSLLGYSTGHMEGNTLVINTSHIQAGALVFFMNHSNKLQAEERYTISEDGQLMTLYVTFTDPVALKESVTFKKIWTWSPDEKIYPYESCEIPTDYLQHQGEGA